MKPLRCSSAHVLSPDILDVDLRPRLAFRSTAVTGAEDEWQVEGELTIGEVTRPVTLDVELGGVGDFPADGSRHAGLEATTEIRRSDLADADQVADQMATSRAAVYPSSTEPVTSASWASKPSLKMPSDSREVPSRFCADCGYSAASSP